MLGPMHNFIRIGLPCADRFQAADNVLVGFQHAKWRLEVFPGQNKRHRRGGMGNAKDKHGSWWSVLKQPQIPMRIRMATTVKIDMGCNETARRQTFPPVRQRLLTWPLVMA